MAAMSSCFCSSISFDTATPSIQDPPKQVTGGIAAQDARTRPWPPDDKASAYATTLRRCCKTRSLAEGKLVHDEIISSGLDGHRFLCNLLVQMYGKCGRLDEARLVFDKMPKRNSFSWSILLTAYAQNGYSREALELYREMERQGVRLDKITFVGVLSACASAGGLAEGKELHARAVSCRLEQEVLVGNALVAMYGKCRSPVDARAVFDKMPRKDAVSWNSMVGAYAQNGHPKEAIELYQRMSLHERNNVTFVSVLEACSVLGDLAEGKAVHADASASGFDSDVAVGTTLVSMYGKCHSLDDARATFESMPLKNVVSWNALIAAYAQNGYGREAWGVYQRMDLEGVKLNTITFLSILDGVSRMGSLAEGKQIHARIAATGVFTSSIENALITMYGKCRSLTDARAVFERMQKKNVISWTAMITAYAQNGYSKEALQLYWRMDTEDVKADKITFISVIGACASLGELAEGRMIHARITASGFESDRDVRTSLINMYGKCQSLENARSLFDNMCTRDQLTWNAMLAAYAQNGYSREAMSIYKMMVDSIKPDGIALVTILAACSAGNSVEDGRAIHADVIAYGYERDDIVGGGLISMYGKCQSLEDARKVFESLRSSSPVPWNAMVGALEQNGFEREAVELYHCMDMEGVKPNETTFTSTLVACAALGDLETGRAIHARVLAGGIHLDEVLGTALIDLYGKCGSMDELTRVYHSMPRKDVVCLSAMVAAYAQNGRGSEALQLYRELDLEGMKPDEVTFINVIGACSSIGALAEGKLAHADLLACGFEPDGVIGTALVCMYAKCGNLDESRSIFNRMRRRDTVAWTAIITAYARHGSEAMLLFRSMALDGFNPGNATFTSTLFAHCHAGVLNPARQFFMSMIGDFGMSPTAEHYSCMVDLLGRAGRVDEAENLVQSMPFEPDHVPWMTLLGACRMHGNMKQGADAAQSAFQLDGSSSGSYVLLSNIYAAAGMKPILDDFTQLDRSKTQAHMRSVDERDDGLVVNGHV